MGAKNTTTDPAEKTGGDEGKTFNQADVDRIVSERLARENGKFGDYDELKKKAEQFDELEQSKKSEVERLNEQNATLTTQLASSQAETLRTQVAHEKGLSPAQARRLVGATQEELEGDADDLLASFAPAEASGTPPAKAVPDGAPKEKLKPAVGDPDAGAGDDDIDYDALAASV